MDSRQYDALVSPYRTRTYHNYYYLPLLFFIYEGTSLKKSIEGYRMGYGSVCRSFILSVDFRGPNLGIMDLEIRPRILLGFDLV
jgi:hypothetical protein